jgi:hypothetical protein
VRHDPLVRRDPALRRDPRVRPGTQVSPEPLVRPITEESDLDWDVRPPWRRPRRGILVFGALALVIVVALVVWLRPDSEPDPAPVPGADAVTLARPAAYEGEAGYPVGFPRTELGAVSAAAAALEAAWTLDAAQAEEAATLYAPPDQREAAREGARVATQGWRETLGLAKDGALPSGAALSTRTIGVQWRAMGQEQVRVSLLVQVTATKGGADSGPPYSSPYAMTLLMAWQPDVRGSGRGDWVNIPDPAPPPVPEVALPGTDRFRAAGWKPVAGMPPTPQVTTS